MAKTMVKHINYLLLLIFFSFSYAERVVGYYPYWIQNTLLPQDIDLGTYTHINHAFVWPNTNGDIIAPSNSFFSNSAASYIHDQDRKFILSLGGGGQDQGFASATSTYEMRSTFIDNILEKMISYDYDGIDIDWEHPQSEEQRSNLTKFVQELDSVLNAFDPELLITMAVPISNWFGQWYDFNNLKLYVDFFNAMTYDIHGSWSSHAGHNSPLYQSPQGDPDGSVQTGINYLTSSGIPLQKINMGIPFWGKQYNTSTINGSFSGTVVDIYYKDIVPLINNGWTYEWDNIAKCPYLVKSDQTKIITYDDPLSIQYKCNYAKNRNLGGVMVWALGYDSMGQDHSLTQSISTNWLSNSIKDYTMLPQETSLSTYPNPFNNGTKIKFELHAGGNIWIKVYNMKGQMIELIRNGYFDAGSHSINFQPKFIQNSLATGIYFLELETSSLRLTKKILYLK